MVSLRRLRCGGEGKHDRRQLRPDPAQPLQLLCPICGFRAASNDYFRRYGSQTGAYIMAGGAMLATSWARTPSEGRVALILTGATVFGYALSRVIWMQRARRWLHRLYAESPAGRAA
jgi:hypothetical protein